MCAHAEAIVLPTHENNRLTSQSARRARDASPTRPRAGGGGRLCAHRYTLSPTLDHAALRQAGLSCTRLYFLRLLRMLYLKGMPILDHLLPCGTMPAARPLGTAYLPALLIRAMHVCDNSSVQP